MAYLVTAQNCSGLLSVSSIVTVQNSYVANYQKNGITGNEVGTTLTSSSNTVFGQGPTTGAAENGIQFGFGATGSATFDTVMDNVYSPGSAAATGILVYASANVSVKSNTVGNSQTGISFDSDATFGSAENGTIVSNKVSATHLFDGIDLCSNNTTVHSNTIIGSDESAIHLDSACGSTGNSNTITNNVINDSCAGILEDPSTTNTVGPNVFHNVTNTVGTGPTCTNPPRGAAQQEASSDTQPGTPVSGWPWSDPRAGTFRKHEASCLPATGLLTMASRIIKSFSTATLILKSLTFPVPIKSSV